MNANALLAGAGVVGLAIGFGAQTLVKDLITGLFILMGDTVRVGDVVDLGGRAGVVEAISMRTVTLRAYNGDVHTIPFSSIDIVTNMTKDFSFYVFDLVVAYKEDVDRVTEVLREIDLPAPPRVALPPPDAGAARDRRGRLPSAPPDP